MSTTWRARKSKASPVKGSGGYTAEIGCTQLEVVKSESGWFYSIQPVLTGTAPTLDEGQEAAEWIAREVARLYPDHV